MLLRSHLLPRPPWQRSLRYAPTSCLFNAALDDVIMGLARCTVRDDRARMVARQLRCCRMRAERCAVHPGVPEHGCAGIGVPAGGTGGCCYARAARVQLAMAVVLQEGTRHRKRQAWQ